MAHNQITVLASYVTELIFHVPRIMRLGETIEGNFETGYGGKGFNMAVAAKRSGGNVNVVMKVGKDVFGDTAVRMLNDEGINTDTVYRDEQKPSGAGVVLLLPTGENAIAIDSGANSLLSIDDVNRSRTLIKNSSIVLSPLEMPVPAIQRAFDIVKESDGITILNPAPARDIPDELYQLTDVITPNETEAELLTGITINTETDVMHAADVLLTKGVQSVVITRGEKKVYIKNQDINGFIYPPAVTAVDTTGAGDAFNGALAFSLAAGSGLIDAVYYATQYSALKVTKKGTAIAMPIESEINDFKRKTILESSF